MAARHYYYEFELYEIGTLLPGIRSEAGRLEARTALIRAGRDLRIMSNHVCPRCVVDAVEFLAPGRAGQYASVSVKAAIGRR
jgi:hypothetical protein